MQVGNGLVGMAHGSMVLTSLPPTPPKKQRGRTAEIVENWVNPLRVPHNQKSEVRRLDGLSRACLLLLHQLLQKEGSRLCDKQAGC